HDSRLGGTRASRSPRPVDLGRSLHSRGRAKAGHARGPLRARPSPEGGGVVMRRIVAIALHTVREAARERIALVALLFGAGLVASSYVLSPLALGEGQKIVTDFGLAGASVLATILAITLGSNLLSKELDRRTIYAVLSKPIRRFEFLFGKFFG